MPVTPGTQAAGRGLPAQGAPWSPRCGPGCWPCRVGAGPRGLGQGPTELWTAGLGRQGGPAHRDDVLPPEAGALHPGSPGDAQGAGWAGQGAGAEADPEPRQEAALGNPFCPEPTAVTGTERAAAGRGVTEWTPRSAVASHGRSRHGSVLRCLQRARRLVLRGGPWNPRGRGVAPAGRGAQEGPPGWRAPPTPPGPPARHGAPQRGRWAPQGHQGSFKTHHSSE